VLRYLLRRLVSYVVMLFVAVSGVYFLASWFMDPRSVFEAVTPKLSRESIDTQLTLVGVNDHTPVLVRYWNWLTGVVTRWDWGLTTKMNPVNTEIANRIGPSAQLLIIGTVLGIVIGVMWGVYTAIRQYKWQDRLFTGISTFLYTVPSAVLGLVIITIGIWINDKTAGEDGTRFFYVTGMATTPFLPNPLAWFADFARHLILPTISLATLGAVSYHLTQRTYLLDTMSADYVRTARAKGLPLRKAISKHAVRMALLPTAISVAFSIAAVFTGAVITERLFAIPGLGSYFTLALTNNDINGVVAFSAFSAVCTLTGALLADVVVATLDPRVRVS
jgi:peptide/nickel transport system permease protein